MKKNILATVVSVLAVGVAAAQEVPPPRPLKPFRGGETQDPPEVKRAEPVVRPAVPVATPVPVVPAVPAPRAVPADAAPREGASKPMTPVPVREAKPVQPAAPAVPTAPAVPAAPPTQPSPAPEVPMPDAAGEIRLAPTNQPLTPEQIQLNLGNTAYVKKDWAQATTEYERFLNLYPNSGERAVVMFRLAESYRLMGSTNNARMTYERLLSEFNAGEIIGVAAFRVGDIFFTQKDYTSALPYFRKAAVRLKDPKLINAANFYAARSLEALGRKTDARFAYEDVLKVPNDNPYVEASRMSYALILKDTGRNDIAIKQLEVLAKTATNPELKARAMVNLGLWQIEMQQGKKAEATLKEALALPEIGVWRELAHLGLVQLQFEKGNYKEVVEGYERTGKDFSPEARQQFAVLAGRAHRQLGNQKEAIELFNSVAGTAPGSVFAREAAWERLAAMYQVDDPNLIAEIDAYLTNNPESQKRDQVQLMKAEVLYKKQDYPAAAPLYEALTKSRQLSGNMKAEALTKLGWCFMQTRELERAVRAYTELIDGYPGYKSLPLALAQRGNAYLRLNNLSAALKDFDRVAQSYPRAKEREFCLVQKALLQGKMNDSAGMAGTFRKLLEDYPNTEAADEANWWIGVERFDAKDYKAAVEPLEKARALNKEEYFERASQRLMQAHYQLEDLPRVGAEIETYIAGGGKNLSTDLLRWVSLAFYERGVNAVNADKREAAVENHQAAVKYLTMLGDRGEARPEDTFRLGRSLLFLRQYAKAAEVLQKYLANTTEPLLRATALNEIAKAQLGGGDVDAAQKSVDEGLKNQAEGMMNAELRITAGDVQAARAEALEKQGRGESSRIYMEEAAKLYQAAAIVWPDDENITPRALDKAIEAYRKCGKDEVFLKKLVNELQSRFPEYYQKKKLG